MLAALVGLVAAAPGDGVQVGGATVTPEVSAGVETSTNVYRKSTNIVPAAGLYLSGSLQAESLGSTSELRLASSLSRTQWLLDFGEERSQYDIWKVSRTDGALDLDWVIAPRAPVSVVLGETVTRQNKAQASVLPNATGRGLVTRTDSNTDLALRIRPGSALAIDVGGFAKVGTAAVSTGPDFRAPNRSYRLGGGPVAQVKWNFFPRTALFLNGEYEKFAWTGDYTTAGSQWRAGAAVNGRVTHTLVINADLGYGRGTFVSGTTVGALDGLLAGAKVMWRPLPGTHLSLGYQKGWEDSFFTDYVAWHYTFAGWDQMLTSSVGLNVEGGLRLENARGTVTQASTLIRADGGVVFMPSEWAEVRLGGGIWQRTAVGAPTTVTVDFPAHLTATVRW